MPSRPQAVEPAAVRRAAIDWRRFPWIRPLVSAYTHDFRSVAELFAGNPADAGAWRDTIARVQTAPRDRRRLTEVLIDQLEQRGAPAAAREAARRLADTSTVAIVTGQQAGVFGGPLYTLLKAVTAIQLAHQVSTTYGTPAVPVFWVDAEDHDWEEVRTAHVLDENLALQAVALDRVEGAGEQPVSALRLDHRVRDTLAALERTLAPTEFTADLLADLAACYQPGATVGSAFAAWIDRLLGPHGLVVYEAGDPAAKPLAADLFARELRAPGRTSQLAREAGERMAALGHAPQVEPTVDGVAVFYLDAGGRRPIRRQGDGFVIGETRRPAPELAEEAETHPERFSPNVLLRPVVQDRLFPTVCYVSGPSELAYQAQLTGVYGAFGVEVPLLYSRASATVLDAAAMRFLERYDLPLEVLHAQDESALNRLLESQLPPMVEQAFVDTEREMAERVRLLREAVVAVDPTLGGAVDTTIDRVRDTLRTLHGKIISASKRKDETLRRQFTRARALAFPGGDPQERVLGVAFFVNRYGPAFPTRLLEVLPLDTGAHSVLVL